MQKVAPGVRPDVTSTGDLELSRCSDPDLAAAARVALGRRRVSVHDLATIEAPGGHVSCNPSDFEHARSMRDCVAYT